MNRYIFLHRIQGPAMLLTFGVAALLDQWDILSFGRSWPLYLIVLGVLKLAQRAALANAEPPPGYPQQGYPGYPPAAGVSSTGSTALIPTDKAIHPDSGDRG
ncbi:LiaI-LiaF-like domain-containing protein [Acidobacterium sp. S8]|uniref:LiaI-LiaF-like domain-containing protein n=1 Tax=Acidobacterium sp. S8 TaxID=1641854 RepID=UPI00131D620F|nr:DUF5668 domain-containing protein [Acidobacterium sp. S8]